jgi:hypothetical protein
VRRRLPLVALAALLVLLTGAPSTTAQGPGAPLRNVPTAPAGTAFSYQGLLKNGNTPVNGACNFQFSL